MNRGGEGDSQPSDTPIPDPPGAVDEIERVYLLDRAPQLPAHAVASRIEQGYLPDDPARDSAMTTAPVPGRKEAQTIVEGRIRRVMHDDGAVQYTHTIKHGLGMVRAEQERSLTEQEFQTHWPRTRGRRLSKTRHRVTEADLVWEIDVFDQFDLVLAEIELPAIDTPTPIPEWLKPHIVREVTEEPMYRNYALATGAMQSGGDSTK